LPKFHSGTVPRGCASTLHSYHSLTRSDTDSEPTLTPAASRHTVSCGVPPPLLPLPPYHRFPPFGGRIIISIRHPFTGAVSLRSIFPRPLELLSLACAHPLPLSPVPASEPPYSSVAKHPQCFATGTGYPPSSPENRQSAGGWSEACLRDDGHDHHQRLGPPHRGPGGQGPARRRPHGPHPPCILPRRPSGRMPIPPAPWARCSPLRTGRLRLCSGGGEEEAGLTPRPSEGAEHYLQHSLTPLSVTVSTKVNLFRFEDCDLSFSYTSRYCCLSGKSFAACCLSVGQTALKVGFRFIFSPLEESQFASFFCLCLSDFSNLDPDFDVFDFETPQIIDSMAAFFWGGNYSDYGYGSGQGSTAFPICPDRACIGPFVSLVR